MYECVKEYSKVRGFNFQPDFGATGVGVWLNYDGARYRELIKTGLAAFPCINALRVWLSFEAWAENRYLFLSNLSDAAEALGDFGLKFIPVYFNGWVGIPSFGAITAEPLNWTEKTGFIQYRTYIRDCAEVLSGANVLVHDICNEPFNNAGGRPETLQIIIRFLSEMGKELRSAGCTPITVGSQGESFCKREDGTRVWDFELLCSVVDVFTLHPYNVSGKSEDEFEEKLKKRLDIVEGYGKPAIITECVWGAPTAEERRRYLESELNVYSRLNVGFLCHALATSPVADLHPVENAEFSGMGLYMAFLDKEGKIRPYHDIFNRV